MIRAVLCDIGNVLVTFNFRMAVDAIATRSEASPDEIGQVISDLMPDHETGRITSDEFVASLIARVHYKDTPASLEAHYCRIFAANEPAWGLIDSLRGAASVHLFSNTSRLHEEHLFASYPVFARTDGGFFSWRLGSMKPARPFYDAAIASLGCAPGEIAYLDDLEANLETGRSLGMHAVHYDARFPDSHDRAVAALAALGLLLPA